MWGSIIRSLTRGTHSVGSNFFLYTHYGGGGRAGACRRRATRDPGLPFSTSGCTAGGVARLRPGPAEDARTSFIRAAARACTFLRSGSSVSRDRPAPDMEGPHWSPVGRVQNRAGCGSRICRRATLGMRVRAPAAGGDMGMKTSARRSGPPSRWVQNLKTLPDFAGLSRQQRGWIFIHFPFQILEIEVFLDENGFVSSFDFNFERKKTGGR